LRNRNGERILASALVSLDFSYLVRLGLRHPLDPRIQDTIRVVDHVLRVDTPSGPVYHRYNGDGYGEHADGRPYNGLGIGRAWPLLVGERGHLALQAGEDPLPYLRTMWRCASPGGLLPEQVWDVDPIPERGLYPGRPSGSAMPLVWAHAEFLKLLMARERGRPVEWLDSVERHFGHRPLAHSQEAIGPSSGRDAKAWHWRDELPIQRLPKGKGLRIEAFEPFLLHVGFDGWQRVENRHAEAMPFGLWSVLIADQELQNTREVNFTRCFDDGWEHRDHRVELLAPVAETV
jgi:glucoamylase